MQQHESNPQWPSGVYREEDGKLYRNLPRLIELSTDPETGEALETYDYRPSEVILATATDDGGILAQQRRAKMAGLDFWHPRLGWLRRGAKRELDWPENQGEVRAPRRRETRRAGAAPGTAAAPPAAPPSRGTTSAGRMPRGAVMAPAEKETARGE